jgi:hypothetical protein
MCCVLVRIEKKAATLLVLSNLLVVKAVVRERKKQKVYITPNYLRWNISSSNYKTGYSTP